MTIRPEDIRSEITQYQQVHPGSKRAWVWEGRSQCNQWRQEARDEHQDLSNIIRRSFLIARDEQQPTALFKLQAALRYLSDAEIRSLGGALANVVGIDNIRAALFHARNSKTQAALYKWLQESRVSEMQQRAPQNLAIALRSPIRTYVLTNYLEQGSRLLRNKSYANIIQQHLETTCTQSSIDGVLSQLSMRALCNIFKFFPSSLQVLATAVCKAIVAKLETDEGRSFLNTLTVNDLQTLFAYPVPRNILQHILSSNVSNEKKSSLFKLFLDRIDQLAQEDLSVRELMTSLTSYSSQVRSSPN